MARILLVGATAEPCPERTLERQGVNRVVLTVCRLLPVYPDKQTFSGSFGMSQRCHKQTHASAANFDAGTAAVHYTELRHCTAASISHAEAGGHRSMIMPVGIMQVCERVRRMIRPCRSEGIRWFLAMGSLVRSWRKPDACLCRRRS
jgi:hypothetical protein